ncbi:hypothetical protein BV898_14148 [Hypsibius exemplaris]|uniref:CAS1 domain-containing protein 1 n=1 Tax=Hypsibius exemplaris TaxID=2072580 RepID=A0A1W0W8T9_HYPEX|nr:hypothetical protein BV898_14148 [Hypsibius exemplaris]
MKWNPQRVTAVWEPSRCTIRYRSPSEVSKCVIDVANRNREEPLIVLVGDSRLRQLRDGLVEIFTGKDFDFQSNRRVIYNDTVYKKHESSGSYFANSGLHLRFEWHAGMDDGSGSLTSLIKELIKLQFKPTIVVIGMGAWTMRQCTNDKKLQSFCVQAYQKEFMTLLPALETLATTSKVIWLPQGAIHYEQLLPRGQDLMAGLNNRNTMLYNNAVREVLESSRPKGPPVIFWESAWEISLALKESMDGLHFGNQTKHHLLQILIEWVCSSSTRTAETVPIINNILFHGRSDRCCSLYPE